MTGSEFTILFKSKIVKYRSDVLIDFGLDICERLLPDYVSFSENRSWGNAGILKDSINFCRKNKGNTQNDTAIQNYLDKLDPDIPDIDEFGDFDGSYALNASAVVYELLEYLLDKDTSHIYNISTYMTDTIDFKLSEADPNLTNEELENHPDIIDERKYQLRLIV